MFSLLSCMFVHSFLSRKTKAKHSHLCTEKKKKQAHVKQQELQSTQQQTNTVKAGRVKRPS